MEPTSSASKAGSTAMIMGIVSIFFSWSLIGIILAVMARVKARRALAEMEMQPESFAPAIRSQITAARHTSNLSLLLSLVWLVVIIIAVRG